MNFAPAAVRPRAGSPAAPTEPAVRRVRHQARDAATVMAFSAVTSLAVALAFLLLALLVRQA